MRYLDAVSDDDSDVLRSQHSAVEPVVQQLTQ